MTDNLKEAVVAYQAGQWDMAIELLQREPDSEAGCRLLVEALAIRGRLNASMEARFRLVEILEAEADLDGALFCIVELARLQPESARARMRRILIHQRRGEPEQVIEQSRELARLYLETGHGEESIQLLAKAQQANPDNLDIGLELAEVYLSQGHIQDGARQYRKVANALLESGQLERAAEAMRRNKVISPDDPALLLGLGNLYCDLGRYPEAEQEFRSILRQNLNHSEALMSLGRVCRHKSQFRDAILAYQRVLNLVLEASPELALVRTQLGELHQMQGLVPEAISHYLEAAACQLELSHQPEAVHLYRVVLALEPSQSTAISQLSQLGEALTPIPSDELLTWTLPQPVVPVKQEPAPRPTLLRPDGEGRKMSKKASGKLEVVPPGQAGPRKGLVRPLPLISSGEKPKLPVKSTPVEAATGNITPDAWPVGLTPEPLQAELTVQLSDSDDYRTWGLPVDNKATPELAAWERFGEELPPWPATEATPTPTNELASEPDFLIWPISDEVAVLPEADFLTWPVSEDEAPVPAADFLTWPVFEEATVPLEANFLTWPVSEEATAQPEADFLTSPVSEEATAQPEADFLTWPVSEEATAQPEADFLTWPVSEEPTVPEPDFLNWPVSEEANVLPPDFLTEPVSNEAATAWPVSESLTWPTFEAAPIVTESEAVADFLTWPVSEESAAQPPDWLQEPVNPEANMQNLVQPPVEPESQNFLDWARSALEAPTRAEQPVFALADELFGPEGDYSLHFEALDDLSWPPPPRPGLTGGDWAPEEATPQWPDELPETTVATVIDQPAPQSTDTTPLRRNLGAGLATLCIEVEARPDQLKQLQELRAVASGLEAPARMRTYRRSLEANPDNLVLRAELADLHLQFGLVEEASVQYRQITKRAPESTAFQHRMLEAQLWGDRPDDARNTLLELRQLHTQRAQHTDALDALMLLLTLDPDDREARRGLVDCFLALGEPQLAELHLKELAECALRDGRLEEAAVTYEELLRCHPDPIVSSRLAEVYLRLQKVEPAVAALLDVFEQPVAFWPEATRLAEGLLELHPGLSVLRERLISVYLRLGRPAEALEQRYCLGLATTDPGEARRHFEAVLATAPDHLPARARLIEQDLAEGRNDEALAQASDYSGPESIGYYQRFLELWPGRAELHQQLLHLFQQTGQLEGQVQQWLAIGELGLARGEWSEAAAAFRNAVALDPTRVKAHYQLARLYSEPLPNPVAALEAFERIHELEPGHLEAMESYARLLLTVAKSEAAARVLAALESVNPAGKEVTDLILQSLLGRIAQEPNDLRTRFILGELNYSLGRQEAAIEQFQHTRRDRTYELASYNLLGLSLGQRASMYGMAVRQFQKGLERPGHPEHDYLELRYNLARLHYRSGHPSEALLQLRDLLLVDITYRDVAEWMNRIERELGRGFDSGQTGLGS